ncbi:MAG: 50S ribosomal protein L15 [Clostridiales bacterium]|nr:50S ribosomal protein L15 [Clostridiales bacterium]MCF8022404.1 50S ribosomal protein L15 [Clostridiales bacterium]
MRLHDLNPNRGARKRSNRVGRGPGSGWGNTAGRGEHGQNSRSGGGVRPGFEGGQMPLTRRLPKKGFSNAPFKKLYAVVNLDSLNNFENEVTPKDLLESNVISKINSGVKILGDGEVKKPLSVKAHAFSKSAKEKIEAAGGKAEVI